MSEQKTLVLTGASRGIGHATVKRFSAEGWRVLTCSRQPFDPRCPWPGGEDNHIEIDLADPNKTIAAIETIKEKVGGRIHALVNNAGISPKGPGGARLNTLTTDLRTWGHVFHVNFFSSVIMARGLQAELAATRGSIVNVTSIAGVRVHPFAGAAYATSKAALAALTREMAHDFGPLGVRVNAIAPGRQDRGKAADAAPGSAEGGRRCHLVPLFRSVQLHFGRRDRGQRRPARLTFALRRRLWHKGASREAHHA